MPFRAAASPQGAAIRAARNRRKLEANQMPPQGGIPDPVARQKLIDMARAFARIGDRALAYEKRQAR
jgi:hypothetical protein